MSARQPGHAGAIELGGICLPIMAPGAPSHIGADEVLIPTGDVTVLHPLGETQFYRHGWNSWSPSGWRGLDEQPLRIYDSPQRLLTADDAKNDTPLAHSGSAVGALQMPDGKVLILGALGLGTPRVGATASTLWGTVESPGGEWYLAVGDELTVFNRYATLVAERLGRRTTKAGPVWCSWYSFYEAIDEHLLHKVIDDLSDYPFAVIQIDDGWERAVGDWEANDKFPSGMADLAQRITQTGRQAGLWLSPLIVLPDSQTFRERREWLVKDGQGAPLVAGYNWGSAYYCLDTTLPAVQDSLVGLFDRCRGWGYSYFKLDFMYAGALEGRRHADVPREQAYRDAIALIRGAVGDDSYLLGSGVPMLPSAGYFDGVRVGPDVVAFWDNAERPRDPSGVGAKNALVASLNRPWLGHLYQLDPDAVYFRRRRSLLDERQRQAIQDAATVLGFKATSDPIDWLQEAEREELRAWIEADECVKQTGRFTYQIDSREVDFSELVGGYAFPQATTAG